MAGGNDMKIDINKKFFRGNYIFSITNDAEEDYFVLKKGDQFLALLVGYNGNIWCKPNYRFVTVRPFFTFVDPIDRLAITDAIGYLEEEYKTP